VVSGWVRPTTDGLPDGQTASDSASPSAAPISGGGSQVQRWKNAKIKVSSEIAVNKAVMLYLRTKDRYESS
jgi:hypothetical protein